MRGCTYYKYNLKNKKIEEKKQIIHLKKYFKNNNLQKNHPKIQNQPKIKKINPSSYMFFHEL